MPCQACLWGGVVGEGGAVGVQGVGHHLHSLWVHHLVGPGQWPVFLLGAQGSSSHYQ